MRRGTAKPTRRVYSYHEVVKTFRDGVERGEFIGHKHEDQVREWKRNSGNFYGDTPDATIERLNKGWQPPASEGKVAQTVISNFEGTQATWKFTDDEGEYEHDLFISGEPEFYLDRPPQPGKPGISILVDLGFACSTTPDVIADYGRWVAAAIRSIGQAGFDVGLTVTGTYDSLYYNEEATQPAIVVKKFGELLMPQDFLVIFSATGYRHLFFQAMMMEEANGFDVSGCLGFLRQDTDWAVGYDPDTRELNVTVPCSARSFPREMMDQMLVEAAESF